MALSVTPLHESITVPCHATEQAAGAVEIKINTYPLFQISDPPIGNVLADTPIGNVLGNVLVWYSNW